MNIYKKYLTYILLCDTLYIVRGQTMNTQEQDTTINFRISTNLKSRVKRFAKDNYRSTGDMVRVILEQNVPKYELSGDSA